MGQNTCPYGYLCFNFNTILLVSVSFALIGFCYRIMTKNFQDIKQSISENKRDIQSQNQIVREHEEITQNVIASDIDKMRYRQRIQDPIEEPTRSYHMSRGIPINIHTRGYVPSYQQMGVLINNDDTNNVEMLPLFGRPTYAGSNKWNYYTSTSQYNSLKIPVFKDSSSNKSCSDEYGCNEIYGNDTVYIPAYKKNFTVELYEIDKPRYIPYL